MSESLDSAQPTALKQETEAIELKSAHESQMAVALVDDQADSNTQAEPVDSSNLIPRANIDKNISPVEKIFTPNFVTDEQVSISRSPRMSAGMRRHNLTVVATGLLAVGVFALNVFDLQPLISVKGTIDRSFIFKPDEKIAEQPTQDDAEVPNDSSWVAPVPVPVSKKYKDDLREGLVAHAVPTPKGPRIGFADAHGDLVIAPVFEKAKNFSDGLAAVKMPGENGNWGFINHAGQFVIAPTYTKINSFYDGFALVMADNLPQIIDKNGKSYLPHNCTNVVELYGGLYSVGDSKYKLWGLMKKGKFVITQRYDDIAEVGATVNKSQNFYTGASYSSDTDNFTELTIGVARDQKTHYFKLLQNRFYGLGDSAGKIYFDSQFGDILSVYKKHAVIYLDGLHGFADLTGKVVIKPKFDEVTVFDDLIAVRDHSKIRFIDSAGDFVRTTRVDSIVRDSESLQWLHDGLGIFKRDGLYGYLDSHGNEIIAPKYTHACFFDNGVARVNDGSRWMFIDTHGNNLSKTKYVEASGFRNGKANVTVPGPFYSAVEEWPKSLQVKTPGMRFQQDSNQPEQFESGDW